MKGSMYINVIIVLSRTRIKWMKLEVKTKNIYSAFRMVAYKWEWLVMRT